jgi:hypothetical protein
MKKAALIGVLALAWTIVPARPAEAQAGFIRWLEKLSGPGPFVGAGFELYGYCYGVKKEDPTSPDPSAESPANREFFWDVNCGRAARNSQRLTFGVQFSRLWGNNNLQYDEAAVPADQRDTVGATVFLGSADLGVVNALDVGAGIGFIHFTGTPPGSFTKLAFEPLRVTWKPLVSRPSRLQSAEQAYQREWLQLRLVMTVIPGGFDAEDFGAIPGSYSSGTEVQANLYVIVNPANLIKW